MTGTVWRRAAGACAAVLALAATGAARAQTAGIALRSATWIESNYPEFARNFQLSGEALLSCRPAAQAKLACKVVQETPEGFGFGGAALDVAWGSRFQPAGLQAAAAHGGALDFPVHFTQRPIPSIGEGPASTEAMVLARAVMQVMGPQPELRLLGREYVEAEAIGMEKLSPQVRTAAQASLAKLRAEAPAAAVRLLGRLLERAIPHEDLMTLAGLFASPEGVELVAAMAAAGQDDKKLDAAVEAWAERHPGQVRELEPMARALSRGEELASNSEGMETLRQELTPAFRADLCRRVTCHPADAPKP